MIIHNLHVKRIGPSPAETDPPLIINADAVLSLPFSLESLQAVSGRGSKVAQLHTAVQLAQFSAGLPLERDKTRYALALVEFLGIAAAKGPDHTLIV
jgi:hypothetical protein